MGNFWRDAAAQGQVLTVTAPITADEIIAHLNLGPHPEGGYFRETFRDEPGHKGRSHSTAILYLLRTGEVSRWHRVDAAEMWHWYGGAPLLLELKHGETRRDYDSAQIGSRASTRMRWCLPARGKALRASGPGRSRAAPWRQASISPASNWLLRASSPEAFEDCAERRHKLHTSPRWGGRRALRAGWGEDSVR